MYSHFDSIDIDQFKKKVTVATKNISDNKTCRKFFSVDEMQHLSTYCILYYFCGNVLHKKC